MPILTTPEFTDFTGISDPQNLAKVSKIIPAFENWIIGHLNNEFLTPNWTQSVTFSFESPNKIKASVDTFLETNVEFKNGMDILVDGSVLNDGVYQVRTVASKQLTLESGYTVVDEDFGYDVFIGRMVWPQGIKYAAAKAIEFQIGKTRAVNEAPNRQNPQDTDKQFAFPQRIMEQFHPWRKMRVG